MVPIGGIIAWSGAIAAIPSNYALCDGNNGTPNLRDRFVIGAGTTYAVGATGGTAWPLYNVELGNPGGMTGVDAVSGLTSTSSDPLPPYYALAYIMRLS